MLGIHVKWQKLIRLKKRQLVVHEYSHVLYSTHQNYFPFVPVMKISIFFTLEQWIYHLATSQLHVLWHTLLYSRWQKGKPVEPSTLPKQQSLESHQVRWKTGATITWKLGEFHSAELVGVVYGLTDIFFKTVQLWLHMNVRRTSETLCLRT